MKNFTIAAVVVVIIPRVLPPRFGWVDATASQNLVCGSIPTAALCPLPPVRRWQSASRTRVQATCVRRMGARAASGTAAG